MSVAYSVPAMAKRQNLFRGRQIALCPWLLKIIVHMLLAEHLSHSWVYVTVCLHLAPISLGSVVFVFTVPDTK